MYMRLTARIPQDQYDRAGSVADFLAAVGKDYDEGGAEFGNHAGIRWTLSFQED